MAAKAVAFVAVAVLVSGCASGPSGDVVEPDAILIQDPEDYSYLALNSSDQRPHIHDYWGGKERIVVYEGSFEIHGETFLPCSAASLAPAVPRSCHEIRPADGQTIIPGTQQVLFTARWTSTGYVQDMKLDYVTANASRTNSVSLVSGKTVTIDVTEEMNDPPHQKVSLWKFYVNAYAAAIVKVDASIEIVRKEGPLGLAPPHPDHYGPNQTLTVFKAKGCLYEVPPEPGNDIRQGCNPTNRPVPRTPPLIPPFTTSLKISLHYNSSTPPAVHYSPLLDWHGADRSLPEKRGLAPTKATPQSKDGLFVWELPVEPRMWDSPYATRTLWELFVRWYGSPNLGARHMDGDYHFLIEVSRRA